MSEETNEIFEYKDGGGTVRKGDPFELRRRLDLYARGDINDLLEHYNSDEPTIAEPATEKLAKVVCGAFRLGLPWDDLTGQGVQEKTWREVLDNYQAFVEKNSEGVETPPVSLPSTAPESSTEAATNNGNSTSTSNAP